MVGGVMLSRDNLTTAIVCARLVQVWPMRPDDRLCREIPKLIDRATEALNNDVARVRQDCATDLRELTENDDDVVGSAETAKILGISLRSVQRKAHRGEIDSEIVGGSLVFKRATVEKYAKEQG
jgi:excisionase family DNA binding protein